MKMLNRIIKWFEKVGTIRAKNELRRLGYTEKYLESLYRKV